MAVQRSATDPPRLETAVERLSEELSAPARDAVVALRGPRRWTQSFEPTPLGAARREHSPVRAGGVYVITGGVGGIGLELGVHLAMSAKAKLVLLGRAGLPERAQVARARRGRRRRPAAHRQDP